MLTTKEFNSYLNKKYSGIRIYIFDSRGDIKLDSIIIPKHLQNQGIGTQILNEITEFADSKNKRLILSPAQQDKIHGTTSRGRLVKFYKRFGFVENKGKDFSISESMFRISR